MKYENHLYLAIGKLQRKKNVMVDVEIIRYLILNSLLDPNPNSFVIDTDPRNHISVE